MSNNFPYLVTTRSVSAFLNGKQYTANNTHINFQRIVEALKTGVTDVASFIHLFNVASAVQTQSAGKVMVVNGVVFYQGQEVHNSLSNRIISMLQEGFGIEPITKFMENLFLNPSFRCVQSVYDFAEHNNCPITPDGGMLMFKKVRGDYYDIHSRTVLNKPYGEMTDAERASLPRTMGKGVLVSVENGNTTISVPRNMVDEDIDRTCSHGLHVCAEHYLPSLASNDSTDHVLIVKVNPRDIVANPRDYNNAKLRVCRYEIVGELPQEKAKTYFTSSVMTGTEDPNASVGGNSGDDVTQTYPRDIVLSFDGVDCDVDVDDNRYVVINGQRVKFSQDAHDSWHYEFKNSRGETLSYDSWTECFGEAVDEAHAEVPTLPEVAAPVTTPASVEPLLSATLNVGDIIVKITGVEDTDWAGDEINRWVAEWTDGEGYAQELTLDYEGYDPDMAVDEFQNDWIANNYIYEIDWVALTNTGDYRQGVVTFVDKCKDEVVTYAGYFLNAGFDKLIDDQDVDDDTIRVRSFRLIGKKPYITW